jgi:homoserine kinase
MQGKITVRVPATTANLGPGFDCLALSLNLWNTVTFQVVTEELAIEIEGEGAGAEQLPKNRSNLVVQAVEMVFQQFNQPLPGLHLHCDNRIPLGSGLGSSAAATLAGLMGANALLGGRLGVLEILELAVKLEGHADNATAALYGGLISVIGQTEKEYLVRRFDLPVWQAAYVLPEIDLPTHIARSILPKQIRMEDAVFNIGRATLVMEALRTGDLDLLVRVIDDRLHQPYRLPMITGAVDALTVARQMGAAVALSGAGPSLIAFLQADPAPAAGAMVTAFQQAGINAHAFSLETTNAGATVHRS